MTAALFLGFLALTATVVVALVGRYLNWRIASGVATGLVIWFMYAGLLGYAGVLKNAARPPGIAFILVPVLALSTFPFLFIPAFFVPLAVVLHVLAIRQWESPAPRDRLDGHGRGAAAADVGRCGL